MRVSSKFLASLIIVSIWVLTGCANSGGIGAALNDVSSAITGVTGAGTDVSGRSTVRSNYSGPRASMAVLRFTDATGGRASGQGWYSRDAGDAMARKLTSSLLATNRFRMIQRKNMSDLMNEINFGASGAVTADSASKFGKMAGARLIVTASITDFEDAGGAQGGAGTKKKKGLAGLVGATSRTFMAVNVEVVDVETSEIVASEQIDATVRDVNFAALLGTGSGGSTVGVAGWDNERKGKALQKVINSAVSFLEDSVPEQYFSEPAT